MAFTRADTVSHTILMLLAVLASASSCAQILTKSLVVKNSVGYVPCPPLHHQGPGRHRTEGELQVRCSRIHRQGKRPGRADFSSPYSGDFVSASNSIFPLFSTGSLRAQHLRAGCGPRVRCSMENRTSPTRNHHRMLSSFCHLAPRVSIYTVVVTQLVVCSPSSTTSSREGRISLNMPSSVTSPSPWMPETGLPTGDNRILVLLNTRAVQSTKMCANIAACMQKVLNDQQEDIIPRALSSNVKLRASMHICAFKRVKDRRTIT